MIEEFVKSATEQEKAFLPEPSMAVFPSELKGILNHLLHQLEGLLDPGPGQGGGGGADFQSFFVFLKEF